MNERGKTQPPLAARDTVTRNVNARFVSPLPPASVLTTPSALKGHKSSRPNTARTSSNNNNLDENNGNNNNNNKPLLLIAAPPGTARNSNNTNVSSPSASFRLKNHQQQQQQQNPSSSPVLLLNNNNNNNNDPYLDDDNLPDDCPPSRRLESAKRKIVQLTNSILAAELASEMRPDLATEIASKEIVTRLLKDSMPKLDEIRGLLEEMASKGVENQFEVAFVSNNQQYGDEQQHHHHQHPTIIIDDEPTGVNDHQKKKKNSNNIDEAASLSPDELARSVIKEKMLLISEPPMTSINSLMSTSTINRNTQVTTKSGQMVKYNRRRSSVASSTTSGGGVYFPTTNNQQNKNNAKRRISIASSLFEDEDDQQNEGSDDDDVFNESDDDDDANEQDENQQNHHHHKQQQPRSRSRSSSSKRRTTTTTTTRQRAVDLTREDDIDTALAKEGKPMLIESSRGLAGLQRTVGSVVQIFDAVSSAQQRAFQHYIDKWFRMAAEILPTVQKNVAPHDFNQIRQFLINTQKIAADSREKLTQLSDQMFGKTREAASNIAVSCAETKDSILKIQQVVHDLKAELALASTMIPQSLYSGPRKEKEPTTTTTTTNAATTNDPKSKSTIVRTDSTVSALTASPSSGNFINNPTSSSSSAPTTAPPPPPPRVVINLANQGANLPPPSQLNPYTGVTYVCVAVENLVNLVFPGSGINTTEDSAAALAVANGTPSAMSVLFAKAGAPHFSFSAAASTTATTTTSKLNNNNNKGEIQLHSFASGKQAMNLVRAFISNTVTPSGGHVIALRPFGPFLVAFDSLSSAVAWTRGLHLYGSTIPWPEDVLSNGTGLFGIVNCKKTKVDPADGTGLDRAISAGNMSAAVLMDTQAAPPAVNQMSITEEIFFNAWRSLLGDGGVLNGPGGAHAQKIARLSLLQMKETFTALQRGRLFERRGPQFKIGMAFESITNVVSTAKFISSLQRGGGIRTMVATATSLCAAASGGTTIGTAEMANLFANARNNTVLGNIMMPPIAVQAEEEGIKLLIAPPPRHHHQQQQRQNSKKSTLSSLGSTNNLNSLINTTSTTSASPSPQRLDNNSGGGASSSVDALGVTWLPLALLPERHRYTLRQCGTERIFKIDFAPPVIPSHLQETKKEEGDPHHHKNPSKEMERRAKKTAAVANKNINNNDFASSSTTVLQTDDEANTTHHHRQETYSSEQQPEQDFSTFFDPRSEHFDAMWWSRDDVSGGGGAAIVRPLQLAYLLPPQPIKPQVCSREQQCDPVSSSSRPTSPNGGGGGTTKNLFSLDQTATSAYGEQNPDQQQQNHHLDEVAAAMENAINKHNNNNNNNFSSPSQTARSSNVKSSTMTKRGNSSTSRRRKRGKEPPVEIEIKLPPAMVERGEQTMIDHNYDFTPLLIDQVVRPEEERPQLQMAALAAGGELILPTELIRSNEGLGGHDSLSDDSAAAVVDMCMLLEKFVHFLSGTIQFKELLAGISKFVGPLHRHQFNKNNNNNNGKKIFVMENNDGDETEGSYVTTSAATTAATKLFDDHGDDEEPSWDSLADTLMEHILARLTYPVPPAQTATFRLLVAGMLSCAAEFVRSVPEEEAEKTMEKFKKVFDPESFVNQNNNNNNINDGGDADQNNNIVSSNDAYYNNNNNNNTRPASSLSALRQLTPTPTGSTSSAAGPTLFQIQQQLQQEKAKRVDPTLKILSSVMTIAQQIKISSLDLADDEKAAAAAVAAAHATALHQQIRRRSRTNSAVQQTFNSSVGGSLNNMNTAGQTMMFGSKANASVTK